MPLRTLGLIVVLETLVVIVLTLLLIGAGSVAPVATEGTSEASGGENNSPGALSGSASSSSNETPAVSPTRSKIEERFDPKDAAGVLVHGAVCDDRGKPVVDASVWFERGNTRRLTPAERGAYAVTGLEPGRWTLRAQAEGLVKLEREVAIPAVPTYRLDVVLTRAWILEVHFVTPDGAPLRDALRVRNLTAIGTRTPLKDDLPMTVYGTLSAIGMGEWHGSLNEPHGRLELREPPPVWVSAVLRSTVLATKLVPAGTREVEFSIAVEDVLSKLATLRLKVIDAATSLPVPQAVVSASDRQSSSGYGRTDASGGVVIEHLVPGLLAFRVRAKGYQDVFYYVRVKPAEDRDLGTIGLHRAVRLKGKVVDKNGKPVQASVYWDAIDRIGFPQPLRRNHSTLAGAEGTFEIWRLGRERYMLYAHTRDDRVGFAVADTSRQTEGVVVQVQPAVSVTFQGRLGPLEACTVTVRDRQRRPVQALRLRPGRKRWACQLGRGKYIVEVHDDDDHLLQSLDLSVGSSPQTVVVP